MREKLQQYAQSTSYRDCLKSSRKKGQTDSCCQPHSCWQVNTLGKLPHNQPIPCFRRQCKRRCTSPGRVLGKHQRWEGGKHPPDGHSPSPGPWKTLPRLLTSSGSLADPVPLSLPSLLIVGPPRHWILRASCPVAVKSWC